MSDFAPFARANAIKRLPILIIAFVALVSLFLFRDSISFDSLQQHRDALFAFRDQYYLWAVLIYSVCYIVMVTFLIPGTLVATLTGGFLFGFWVGGLTTILSATIGATLVFFAVRFGFGEAIVAKMDNSAPMVKKIKDGIKENEWSVMFLLRLVPVLPFPVANALPALLGVRPDRYVIATFFGIAPGSMIYTWIGVGLGEVLARGERPNVDIVFEPYILGPLLGLIALACLPIFVKFGKTKTTKTNLDAEQ